MLATDGSIEEWIKFILVWGNTICQHAACVLPCYLHPMVMQCCRCAKICSTWPFRIFPASALIKSRGSEKRQMLMIVCGMFSIPMSFFLIKSSMIGSSGPMQQYDFTWHTIDKHCINISIKSNAESHVKCNFGAENIHRQRE